MKVDIILVPTDFSDDAKQALETAVDLAGTLGSRVVLLHAYHLDLPFTAPPIGGPLILPDGFFEYRNQAKLEVESAAKEAAAGGCNVTGIAIERPAWEAILDQAKELKADLIVMGTRGLTGLKHLAMGSTAERVVRMAECPVLTVKHTD